MFRFLVQNDSRQDVSFTKDKADLQLVECAREGFDQENARSDYAGRRTTSTQGPSPSSPTCHRQGMLTATETGAWITASHILLITENVHSNSQGVPQESDQECWGPRPIGIASNMASGRRMDAPLHKKKHYLFPYPSPSSIPCRNGMRVGCEMHAFRAGWTSFTHRVFRIAHVHIHPQSFPQVFG
ncbi:hypothetical protein BC939DRAFT_60941 [Gamsiella multidivaricata]|uniref:uncharacterized protein n=1 Tax=Gamsiella multidivaricata TaxID=101098 RepID=UPI00221EE324|nr:uncharacterized protein BC939DRAFT_60941 [Gamsiella multidivaricata]KAI7828591.1 hypothetical protein BC939DRAFT_60941 [Gamsiella multidivaricata]